MSESDQMDQGEEEESAAVHLGGRKPDGSEASSAETLTPPKKTQKNPPQKTKKKPEIPSGFFLGFFQPWLNAVSSFLPNKKRNVKHIILGEACGRTTTIIVAEGA